jgi:hypothetical protein
MYYSYKIETQNLFKSLDIKPMKIDLDQETLKPQIIFADNQGVIKLSKNPQHHNWTKHIDVKYHFIRESSQNGLIWLSYIPSDKMVADILTKSLPQDWHEKHIKRIEMTDSVEVI